MPSYMNGLYKFIVQEKSEWNEIYNATLFMSIKIYAYKSTIYVLLYPL